MADLSGDIGGIEHQGCAFGEVIAPPKSSLKCGVSQRAATAA